MARNLVQGKSTTGAAITVYWDGTAVKPTIYVDEANVTTKANPFNADFDGSYGFWVEDGHYKIVNGSIYGDLTNQRIQAAPTRTVQPSAKDISVIPFMGNTSKTVEEWLETAYLNYQPLDAQLTSLAALDYVGNSLKQIRVNVGETGFELAAGGGASGANPTANVGLTAVNGVAATFLRSDGAPALDVGIAPTWTAVHTFSQAIGNTSTDGIVLSNPTAATVGAQKWSPALHFKASGWGTTGGAAQSVDWKMESVPLQSTVPANIISISSSVNGAAYTEIFKFCNRNKTFQFQPAFWIGAAEISDKGSGQLTFLDGNGYGVYFATGSINIGGNRLAFGSSGDPTATQDAFIFRAGAANLQFGTGAANPPVAQTLSVQDASGTDIAGATWTFRGSRGTGAGAVTGKSFIWQTPDVLGSGTTLQTATEKMSLTGDGILTVTGKIVATKAIRLASYTVGTLPAANAGDTALVTDALGPAYGAAVVGGGAVTTPVFYAAAWTVG